MVFNIQPFFILAILCLKGDHQNALSSIKEAKNLTAQSLVKRRRVEWIEALCVFLFNISAIFRKWVTIMSYYTYPSPTKRDAYLKSQQISAINHIYLDYL